MHREDLLKKMETQGFRKITGPPEDWLKALVSMEWGFRDKERLRKEWEKIMEGDIFIFHSMKTEHLGDYNTPTGIVGVGVVSSTYEGEDNDPGFEPSNLRPLRMKFGETWWFGNIDKINVKEPFVEKVKKGRIYIRKEVDFLVINCLTFSEMKAKGFTISTQGAIQNVKSDKWKPLTEMIGRRMRYYIKS
ncbi:hypothetical protein [Sulfuracidifex metallicus]|uniref:EVE domain-containing protein n=1 Tax=Sulfuracidifex metallicus DSM 6482 = JCM 9184 TaxID=523847 RepID=A0A6A9QMM5_SULME|nr:hypothetical protein [Sulfuracidifex metallicus]MUN29560.1 hypothetical protein [Sulfuracidifex metallicus DSM 6482 = JCM 9184]WOE49930.1 hypothetical protein RQ359_001422 [Sulfuracidifex metallicus DSM 6482 = JCM 9184]